MAGSRIPRYITAWKHYSPDITPPEKIPRRRSNILNLLNATLKPQSNGPSYSNTVIGTLAVDGWAVTFGTARRDWAGPQPSRPLLVVPNGTTHLLTTSVPTSYYSMWRYNCLWSVKG